jgi:hypothetical protein
MKRVLVMAVAVLALVAGVSTAIAKIGKGEFIGKTSADDPIGFKVDSKGRIYSFHFEGVTLKCTDGDQFDTPSKADAGSGGPTEIRTPNSQKYKVKKRKFKIVSNDDEAGNGWTAKGKFSSKNKSKGTFTIFANFDPAPANTPNPDGSVHCTSGKLPFTVKRK